MASNGSHVIKITLKQQKKPFGHSDIFATHDEFLLNFFSWLCSSFCFQVYILEQGFIPQPFIHGSTMHPFLNPLITVPPLSFNSVFAQAHVETSMFPLYTPHLLFLLSNSSNQQNAYISFSLSYREHHLNQAKVLWKRPLHHAWVASCWL